MNIACIDCSLVPALESLGHTCLALHPPSGYSRLSPLLEQADFKPDIIVQQETLGPRKILIDLDAWSCCKAFWSIDTHLNAFWQVAYGRLFDLVLTTQKDWVDKLKLQGLPHVAWLPWYGFEHSWTPWERRAHEVCFVGRVTGHRMPRKNLVDFLCSTFNAMFEQNISFAAMKSLYADSRIAPNESIMAEVNFRSFEAASCGCLVINQRFDNGLEELFEPGREMDTFDHVLELESKIAYYRKNTQQARMVALAGRERVLDEHLPVHRAKRLLALCESSPPTASRGIDSIVALAMTQWIFHDADRIVIDLIPVRDILLSIPCTPDGLATLIRIVHATGSWENLRDLILPILQQGQYAHHLGVNLSASMAALHYGQTALAKQFLLRHIVTCRLRENPGDSDPVSISRSWSRILLKEKRIFRIGLSFNPKKSLPETALECLLVAESHDPDNPELVREISGLFGLQRGLEGSRLRTLSFLSLRARNDWRMGCELALNNLRVFRKRQGLEELVVAHDLAVSQGQRDRFMRTIKRMDPSGMMELWVSSMAAKF
ncbi:glycosyltransferase family protein [Desulfoplanes formicivorans]|uniref:Spore protein YkvP/CgeB glycosyl transferase-like domain-containing protein n=1 Tax=Desulfoplanes formicivorans TaxID=1592317 RepID=A0A194AH57_9BACT|nr:glycosyltransferase [Desulfoplanes formicivorans]GAU08421.1 hypothetical protein DPF_1129 [Desulfoplanes formicivorans]